MLSSVYLAHDGHVALHSSSSSDDPWLMHDMMHNLSHSRCKGKTAIPGFQGVV